MNPVHSGGSLLPSFLHTAYASDNASASQADAAPKKKAEDATNKAASYLSIGKNTRIIKDRIARFLDARRFNQEAHDALAKIPAATGNLGEMRAKIRKQGADIAEELFNIRKRQSELEPPGDQKIERQKAAVKEAEILIAHLQDGSATHVIKLLISQYSEQKAELASLVSRHLWDAAGQSTGKERVEQLREAKKYTAIAAHSLRQTNLAGRNRAGLHQMQRDSWVYIAKAADTAYSLWDTSWNKLTEFMQLRKDVLPGPDLYLATRSNLETLDYCLDVQRELYDTSKELLGKTGNSKLPATIVEEISRSKARTEREITRLAVQRFLSTQLVVRTRLAAFGDVLEGIFETIKVCFDEMYDGNLLVIGAFETLIKFDASDPTLVAQMQEVLPSLIEFTEDIAQRITWLSNNALSASVADKTLVVELQRSYDSALTLKERMEAEYNNISEITRADSSRSRQNKLLTSSLSRQGESSKVQRSSPTKDPKSPSATAPKPDYCVIDTRFNGKLIGTSRGDHVTVENGLGQELEFRRDGEKWVRNEEPAEDDSAGTQHTVMPRQTELAQAMYAKHASVVDNTERKVNNLKNEALKYIRLSDFAANNGAPFSQTIGIFNLAMGAYRRAISMIEKTLTHLNNVDGSQPGLEEHRSRLQGQLTEVKTESDAAKAKNLDRIKRNPSGPALGYLMDEQRVTAVRKTLVRKKLTGPNVPLNKQDFMDEYQPVIDNALIWPVHRHYRTKNAPIQSATASHITWETENGKIRLPVSLNLVERLEAASKSGI